MTTRVLPNVTVGRGRPTRTADSNDAVARGDAYGALFVQSQMGSKLHALADEGSYFVFRNATPGTGIAGHAAPTTIDDTKPFILIKNPSTAAEGKRLYLDYLKTEVTAAGTGGTNLRYAIKTDNISRYSSGGSDLTVVNPNMDSSESGSAFQAKVGAVVAAAASSDVRIVDAGLIRTVINVIGDRYLFTFGSSQPAASGMVLEGTAQAQVMVPCPPVIVGPGQTFLFHFSSASQTAASSHEVVLGAYYR